MTDPTPGPAVPPPPPGYAASPPSTPAPAPVPYGQQPGPAYGVQPGVAYGPRTNTMAIIALVMAFVVPLGAIVCGHIALGQIRRTGEAGRGLALAGAIIGYVVCGFAVLMIVLYLVFMLIAFAGFAAFQAPGLYS